MKRDLSRSPSLSMHEDKMQRQSILAVTTMKRFRQINVCRHNAEFLKQLLAVSISHLVMLELFRNVAFNRGRTGIAHGTQAKVPSQRNSTERPHRVLKPSLDILDDLGRDDSRLSAEQKLNGFTGPTMKLKNADIVRFQRCFQSVEPLLFVRQRPLKKHGQRPPQLIGRTTVFFGIQGRGSHWPKILIPATELRQCFDPRKTDVGVFSALVADQSRFHWHKASGERGGDGGVACSDVADQSRFHWHKASGERGYREERASAEQPQLSAFPNSALAAVAFAATGFTPVERRLASYKPCPKTHPGHHRPRAGGAMTGQLLATRIAMTGQLIRQQKT